MNIIEELKELQTEAILELNKANDKNSIETMEKLFFGRKGKFVHIVKHIKDVKVEDRKNIGTTVSRIRKELENRIDEKLKSVKAKIKAEDEDMDVTMPLIHSEERGCLHPITQMENRIHDAFRSLNFDLVFTREIESEYYNFEALNMPFNHPARDMQDTFYLEKTDKNSINLLLRTHTSNTQGHYIERHRPPLRVITTGTCYRRDADLTHTPMFHQFEGLWIDAKITMSDLKGLLESAMSFIMEKKIKVRFRISYFPFVEPGAEFDVSCTLCNGSGCQTCKHTGWLEMGGCGMVHWKVLENFKLDPRKFQGIAWGFGIERLFMIKHRINDIRLFFQNDIRFLKQFPS